MQVDVILEPRVHGPEAHDRFERLGDDGLGGVDPALRSGKVQERREGDALGIDGRRVAEADVDARDDLRRPKPRTQSHPHARIRRIAADLLHLDRRFRCLRLGDTGAASTASYRR